LIDEIVVIHPSVLTSSLEELSQAQGKKLLAMDRRGKQIFMILDAGVLTLHLGMTGEVEVGERLEGKHVAARLRFGDVYLSFIDQRRFGALGYARSMEDFIRSHDLGEDILKIGRQEFTTRLRKSRRPIKSILLDQSVSAGIGNLYADEALFQALIHPLRAGASLNEGEADRIWRTSRMVIRRSLAVATDFDRLPNTYLLRDRTPGGKCPRCHSPLDSLMINGRTSIFCPSCQKR
jgi:formamidopyrimidine-DNA glycosylase